MKSVQKPLHDMTSYANGKDWKYREDRAHHSSWKYKDVGDKKDRHNYPEDEPFDDYDSNLSKRITILSITIESEKEE